MKRIQDWSTSRRFVYFVQAATGEIKIGLAIDVKKRLRELQIGCPIDLQLILAIPGTFRTEQHVHRLLAASRVRSNSEWFFPTDEVHQFLMERGAGENWFVQSINPRIYAQKPAPAPQFIARVEEPKRAMRKGTQEERCAYLDDIARNIRR